MSPAFHLAAISTAALVVLLIAVSFVRDRYVRRQQLAQRHEHPAHDALSSHAATKSALQPKRSLIGRFHVRIHEVDSSVFPERTPRGTEAKGAQSR